MRRGFFDDWHNQGLFLLADGAAVAGFAHHLRFDILCGLMLGMVLMVYMTMLARAILEAGR